MIGEAHTGGAVASHAAPVDTEPAHWAAGASVPLIAAAALIVAALMTSRTLQAQLPPHLWWQAVAAPDLADPRQLLVHFGVLPRLVVCWLCGASLALAGTLLQQVTHNPLAEPGTFGLSSGAFLALTLALVIWPDLGLFGQEAVAAVGAGLVALFVFGLMLARQLSPAPLLFAGMVAGMTCAAVASCVLLFANPYDTSLFLWGSGSLSQNDWTAVSLLWPPLLVCLAATFAIVRPLQIVALDAAPARSLGVRVFAARATGIALAIVLTASVTAAVGVIGFVGFAAPVIADMMGARRLARQILWAPPIGALLLWLTDQAVLLSSGPDREWIPTGAATALAGAPLLIWFAARAPLRRDPPHAASAMAITPVAARPLPLLAGLVVLLVVGAVVSLCFGNGVAGWHWSGPAQAWELSSLRGPRLFGAMAAGAMLATAGVMLQRLTGNPLAAPESLGVGSGAALGMIVFAFFSPVMSGAGQWLSAACGAGLVLVVTMAVARGTADPGRQLLVGIALAAFLNVAAVAAIATGGANVTALRVWLAGATQFVTARQSLAAGMLAVVLIGTALFAARWLDLLSLGGATGRALGLCITTARLLLSALAAGLTAAAVLIVGPLGFVGLMGPHLARMAGLRRPSGELGGAAAISALLMVVADWLGRNLLFPYELPAGLPAAFLGGLYFLWLMRRTR